jgi:hydroxypyruvate isomerase
MRIHQSARREFLKSAVGVSFGVALCQRGGAQEAAGPIPPPKQAKVTSSVMLWTLKGTMEQKLAAAAEAGIQSTELVSEQQAWTPAETDKYKKLARSYGLTFDTIVAQTDWTKRPVSMVNPAHRDNFLQDVKNGIDTAKRLGVPQIILLSGNEQPGMSREDQHASLVEGGKRAAELAAAAGGVTLILENLNSKVNHKGYYLTTAKEALEVTKAVDNPHFRMLFDIYHEYVQNGDPIPVMGEAEPYVAVYHVADAPGRHDPGSAEMKWDDIYKAIGKSGYSGYITLEYLPLADQVASMIKAVTQMRKGLNAGAAAAAKPA